MANSPHTAVVATATARQFLMRSLPGSSQVMPGNI
jgi:hypothetical protein